MAKDAKDMDLDELAQQTHLRPDSLAHLAAHAEFIRPQTDAQLDAEHAQIVAARAEEMAAKACIATADATKTNARYLLASVIVAPAVAGNWQRPSSKLVPQWSIPLCGVYFRVTVAVLFRAISSE